ncbi:hypothetical protein VTO42DRAFT_6120 [Malbranchea cinnamomea]
MPRFSPIPPAQQTPEQRAAHEAIDHRTRQRFGSTFTLKNEEGALIGPFAPLLYTPTLAIPWLNLSEQVLCLPALTERERELAILAVLSRTRAAYAVYAHTRIAEKVGLSASQIADASAGKTPVGLSAHERAVFEFAAETADLKGGALPRERFDRINEALGGREKVAAVMHTVASFLYASVLLNVANVGIPGEKPETES